MRRATLWCSTYREECTKLLVTPNRKVLECVEQSEDADVSIRVAGRADGPAMNALDVTALALTLRAYPLVHSLTLTHHTFGDGATDALQELLYSDSTLAMLELRYSDIGPSGCAKICGALAENSSLRVLDLSGNPIGFEGGFCAAEMLQTNESLVSLALDDTDVETQAVTALATALRENQTLTAFSLSNPRLFSLGDETTVHFATMLGVNTTLQSLDISKHGISEHGLRQVVTALLAPRETPSALRGLSLRCNKLGDESAPLLAALIAQSELEILNLSSCAIKDEGAIAISRALMQRGASMAQLDLSHNSIRAPGMKALAEVLAAGAPLHALSLWGNIMDGRAASAFASALQISAVETDFVVYQPDEGRYTIARAN
ncbi:hypothetical protein T492DRAFT_1098645 [Pavlovales sp. CCMP2436]|nr:hypothetical protein T492DRAFT_1098645 [Pavlovales sp. CCMP2436]